MRLAWLCVACLLLSNKPRVSTWQQYQQRVAATIAQMMRNYAITYVYGGTQVHSAASCTTCVQCLVAGAKQRHEARKRRRVWQTERDNERREATPQAPHSENASHTKIMRCPICAKCSLDCSHFIHHVFNQVGLHMPYLTTGQMLQLSPQRLQKVWHLVTMPHQLRLIRPLDLLVYKGHVVMVETVARKGHGTIVHVTAGKDLRGPGIALQREHQVEFAHFRGPLRRILRHRNLIAVHQ